jgi:hypothetical protein
MNSDKWGKITTQKINTKISKGPKNTLQNGTNGKYLRADP